VALHILEEEPGFLNRVAARYKLDLDMRDDPLMREDELRMLAGPAGTDVTEKYAM